MKQYFSNIFRGVSWIDHSASTIQVRNLPESFFSEELAEDEDNLREAEEKEKQRWSLQRQYSPVYVIHRIESFIKSKGRIFLTLFWQIEFVRQWFVWIWANARLVVSQTAFRALLVTAIDNSPPIHQTFSFQPPKYSSICELISFCESRFLGRERREAKQLRMPRI